MLRLLMLCALLLPAAGPALCASEYAGEFLSLGAGARAQALGSAYVALADDATAGYWNPAGLTLLDGRQIHLMHAERFSGLVRHDFLAFARPGRLFQGWALSLARVGVGDIHFTELQDPGRPLSAENRPLVAATHTSADYALYLSGGRRLSENLSAGASLKFIYRDLASFSAWGAGLDLGLRYRLFSGLSLAATLRDATTTPIRWSTDATDRIQPSLLLGAAWQRPLAGGQTTALVAARAGGQAEDLSDAAPLNAGLEYRRDFLALRAGFEEGRQAFGIGLRAHRRVDLDLAYLQHDDLESTYQLSAGIRF